MPPTRQRDFKQNSFQLHYFSVLSSVMFASVIGAGSSLGLMTPALANSTPATTDASYVMMEQLLQQVVQSNLATHPTWQRLHYYQLDQGQFNSQVENTNFFLHPNGMHDPQAELEATLTAMMSDDVMTKKDVACRFPARVHWLKTELNLSDAMLNLPNCPEFDAWMNRLDPQALSVVFAEEYLDNPLSAFGHSLMKIDSTESLDEPTAIHKAHALNATVDGNPEDNFAVYAVKSSTGVYPSKITIDPYPEKLAYYLQHDNRDVWTYRLKLSQDEVMQIMRHVWESKDLGLPYYFTKDNCATEILRLIDVVRPDGNLKASLPVVVVPSDVVRLLQKVDLISQAEYLPADSTLRQAKLNAEGLNLPQMDDLPNSVLSHDFYQNLAGEDDELITPPKHNNTTLVTTNDVILPARNNPLTAHELQRVMVGVGQVKGTQADVNYATLDFRAGFGDLLDRPNGYPEFFDLNGASFGIKVYKDAHELGADDVELTHATLIEGRSFNPINTSDIDKGVLGTWGASLGVKQVQEASATSEQTGLNNSEHLVGNFRYEKGVSYAFGSVRHEAGKVSGEMPSNLCYALGMGTGQVGKGLTNGYRVGAGVNLGCAVRAGENLRALAELSVPYWYHGEVGIGNHKSGYWQPVATLGVQYDLTDIINKNHAVRVSASHELNEDIEADTEVQLRYGWYF